MEAQLQGIDAEEAAAHLFEIGGPGLGAGATGEVSRALAARAAAAR